MIVNVGGN